MLGAALALLAAFGTGTATESASLGSLQQAVATQRAAIQSLFVRATSTCENSTPGSFPMLHQESLSDSTGRARVTRLALECVNLKGEKTVDDHRIINATDKVGTITISEGTKTAAISDGIIDSAKTNTVDWHSMNLYNPGIFAPANAVIPDLVHLANNPLAGVRPDTEDVAGRACHVLDVAGVAGLPSTLTAWVDVERCVVMKWDRHHKDGKTVYAFEATKVEEIEPGIWFVTEGTKIVSADYTQQTKWTIAVDRSENDKPELKVNVHPEPSVFTPTIPSGYWVRDPDMNYTQKP